MRRPGHVTFRLLMVAFVASAALAGGTAAGADEPALLEAQADALGAENASLGELENGALLELYSLETRLGRAEQRLAELEARAGELEERERSARQALRLARTAEAIAQKQLGDRLTALYVEGETDPLEVLLGATSLDEAISALDGLERLAAEDDRIVAQVEGTRARLGEALVNLKREESRLSVLLADARAARDSLAAARDERADYVSTLRRQQHLNEVEIASLTAQAEDAGARSAELTAQAASPEPSAPAGPAAPEAAPAAAAASVPSGGGRRLTVDAVAYSLPGYTASGLPVGKGVVAVDPTVIPLGTRMFVPGYGPAIAADVGTAIKGLIIDLWFPTYEQAAAWGRQTVTITVYD
jgi:3D (Asp-Asp-Asp) domain-containing protein